MGRGLGKVTGKSGKPIQPVYKDAWDAQESVGVSGEIEPVDVYVIPSGPFKGRAYIVGEDGRLGQRVRIK